MEPSPLEISNLRLRLRGLRDSGSGWQELSSVLDEIAMMGQHAGPLIPELTAAIKRGVYIPTIPLVPIIARLKNAELLSAALEQKEGDWPLSSFERCELLKAGFLQFQEQLLAELFQIFERDDEPRRSAIVEALAVSGTASALEALRVIEFRTAARIPELGAELNTGGPATQSCHQLQRGENLDARKDFLAKVRHVIQQIGARPDPVFTPERLETNGGDFKRSGEIPDLLQREEDSELEFKAALRWDHVNKVTDPKLGRRVLLSVASFANAKGGTLLIGIDPQKNVVGLQNDYTSLKGDRDLFERHLRQLVERLGKSFPVTELCVSFHQVRGCEICRVTVNASTQPLFVKFDGEEEFWVRNGNANIQLKGQALAQYVQKRFS